MAREAGKKKVDVGEIDQKNCIMRESNLEPSGQDTDRETTELYVTRMGSGFTYIMIRNQDQEIRRGRPGIRRVLDRPR